MDRAFTRFQGFCSVKWDYLIKYVIWTGLYMWILKIVKVPIWFHKRSQVSQNKLQAPQSRTKWSTEMEKLQKMMEFTKVLFFETTFAKIFKSSIFIMITYQNYQCVLIIYQQFAFHQKLGKINAWFLKTVLTNRLK